MTTSVCAECAAEIPAASQLCPECGFPARGGTTSCPECLNPVQLSGDACPECGFPLEELRSVAGTVKDGGAAASPVGGGAVPFSAVTLPEAAEAGGEVTNQVLRAQIDSLNLLTAAIGTLMANSSQGTMKELMASISSFVESAENNNQEMLSDLITDIGKFVESSEKIKEDMVASMREQNLITASSLQEIVTSFSHELRGATSALQEAQKSSAAELNALLQQVRAAASDKGEAAGGREGSPYLLYICAAIAVFTILNFFVTAYVVRLVK